MADGPLVEIEGLTFRYRRAAEPAIRDISLAVHPGEVLLVAGPSGCGKSTLLRAINGLIPHAYRGELRGRVRIQGHETTALRLRELARLVGTVLQDPRRQLVASTVRGELVFGPENVGMSAESIGHALGRVVARASIGQLLDRTTDELSGGESQQIAIGGALVLEPNVMVLDEPLANLDPAAAHRLLRLLRELADNGTAVLIVEHRVEDALGARPDRVLYLDEGSVAYDGPLPGFFEVADPTRVKLPFDVAVRRARSAKRQPPNEPFPVRTAPGAVPPRIEWRHVKAGYDGRTVLHDTNAQLGAHEVIAVLGPNGSGKTTLFKTAIGLVPTSAGEVLVDGVTIQGRRVADLAGTFGYVFQNPSQMLFAPSVREELIYGPRNLGRDEGELEMLVERSLRSVSLEAVDGILERPPLTLSFGQQKRLALAVALALEPRTLVLDEPSAGQDHRSSTAFMAEVQHIAGLESVYFVTHDADLALTYADRIVLLRDGRIVADGAPLEVIADREGWEACNLSFTSLMEANVTWGARTGRFMGTDELAPWVAARSEDKGG
jgi:energy-coupling factor transport system ATP-binding protein